MMRGKAARIFNNDEVDVQMAALDLVRELLEKDQQSGVKHVVGRETGRKYRLQLSVVQSADVAPAPDAVTDVYEQPDFL